jgi:hypothetical protein
LLVVAAGVAAVEAATVDAAGHDASRGENPGVSQRSNALGQHTRSKSARSGTGRAPTVSRACRQSAESERATRPFL